MVGDFEIAAKYGEWLLHFPGWEGLELEVGTLPRLRLGLRCL